MPYKHWLLFSLKWLALPQLYHYEIYFLIMTFRSSSAASYSLIGKTNVFRLIWIISINLKLEGWCYLEFDKNAKVFSSDCLGQSFASQKLEFVHFWKVSNIEAGKLAQIFILTNSSSPRGTCNSFLLRISNRREFLRCSIMKILKYFMPARIFNSEKKLCISCYLTRPPPAGDGWRWSDMTMWPFLQILNQPWRGNPMNEQLLFRTEC